MDPQFACSYRWLDCMTQQSPCAVMGDHTSAEFIPSSNYCKSVNMTLVTPLDVATIDHIGQMCSTTFLNTKWNISANGDNKCVLVDRDDPTVAINSAPGAFWNDKTNEPTAMPRVGQCNNSGEACSALYCDDTIDANGPIGCVSRAHDRSCDDYGANHTPWRAVRCLVCAKRETTTTVTTTTTTSTKPPAVTTTLTTSVSPTRTSTTNSTITKPSSLTSSRTSVIAITTGASPKSTIAGATTTTATMISAVSGTSTSVKKSQTEMPNGTIMIETITLPLKSSSTSAQNVSLSLTSGTGSTSLSTMDAVVSAIDSQTLPLGAGPIAGIAILAFVLCATLIAAAVLLLRRRSRLATNPASVPAESQRNSQVDAVYGSSGFSQLT
jgi:hypothetical protein